MSLSRHSFVAPLSLSLLLALGCAQGSADSAPSSEDSPPPGSGGDAERAIAEADIIQLDGGRLSAMSKSGTVSVIDVSVPGRLALLGQTLLAGEPFEMYRRGDFIVAMSNGAVTASGGVRPPTGTRQTLDPAGGAAVIVLDAKEPARLSAVAMFDVTGEIADSRIVGDVLYLATYENAACFHCGPAPRTIVTSFNLADPREMRMVDQMSFQSNAPDGYNLPWGSHWKRSIFVTDQRLYIGGHADVAPEDYGRTGVKEGIIDVIDVSDPSGRLGHGARLNVAGALLSRWQLDERQGILRVVSQRGAGRTGNGLAEPEVETFRIDSTQSFAPLGQMTMRLPRPEGLRTVRFDGTRAYAITYNQTDPLFVIDLADPTRPVQRGELFMPGFMFYLEPYGDRLIGLGVDRDDPGGSLNVSLFDVSDAMEPRMVKRVAFGAARVTEDFEILNSEISEDQDRIQKAFHVFPDGLVAVPFSALRPYWQTGSSCDNSGGGVQLVAWQNDTLTKRALLPVPGNPRRALQHEGELLAISDSHVRAFTLADTGGGPRQTADLVIGTCEPRSSGYDYRANGVRDYDDYPRACSMAHGRGGAPSTFFALLVLGAVVPLRRLVRRARQVNLTPRGAPRAARPTPGTRRSGAPRP
jgi:hypothetical protein